jgi:hypothetical protein
MSSIVVKRSLIEYELKYSRHRDAVSRKKSTSPTSFLTERPSSATSVRPGSPLLRMPSIISPDFINYDKLKLSSSKVPVDDDIDRLTMKMYKEWKEDVQTNCKAIKQSVSKFSEHMALSPHGRPNSPPKMKRRPKTAESLASAMRGFARDIEKQKINSRLCYAPLQSSSPLELEESLRSSVWDERFIFEKPLSPLSRPSSASRSSGIAFRVGK